ncbi:hypothetical protein ACHAC9_14630 [Massilia sp. CMS3.1]|uniref:hypothetical protein n=1 Tax=Massilia sp. CMS3.1 TaxID=3373083 RepID=UPI003EE71BE3
MEQFELKHGEKVKAVSVDDDCFYIDLLCGLRLAGPRLVSVPLSEAENMASPRNGTLRAQWEAAPAFE